MTEDDGARETHGIGRDGCPRVTVTESGTTLRLDLHGFRERVLTIPEAKAFRRGLSRLIRRIERREEHS